MHFVREGSSPFRGTLKSLFLLQEMRLFLHPKFISSILFLISSLLIISCGDSSDSITGGESVGPPPEWPEEE